MACIFESGCLSKDIYQSKVNACKKKFVHDNEEVENCIGLSDECRNCIESSISSNTDIQSKCCYKDSQDLVENFFKKNMSWIIPVVVISVLLVIGLIIFLIITIL